jgi:hypothetical protein
VGGRQVDGGREVDGRQKGREGREGRRELDDLSPIINSIGRWTEVGGR